MLLNWTILALNTNTTVSTCLTQLSDSVASPWNDSFGFLADINAMIPGSLKVGNPFEWSIGDTVFAVINLVIGFTFLYFNAATQYAYYYFGKSLGSSATAIFILVDIWAQTRVMTPRKPWIRAV